MPLFINGDSVDSIHELARQLGRAGSEAGAHPGLAWKPAAQGGSTTGASSETLRQNETRTAFANAYQSISRSVMLVCGIYFAIIGVVDYFVEAFAGFLVLGGISFLTSLSCLMVYRDYRKRSATFERIEAYTFIVFAEIYAGLIAHHSVHLEPARLVYFVFLTLAVASLSISFRLALAATVFPFVTMLIFAWEAGPEILFQYFFVGLAGSVVSFCIANVGRAAIGREIRARLSAERLREAAQAQAESDMLTGLPNRRQFFTRLQRNLAKGTRTKQKIAVGIIDLDGFKPINDTFGHVIGDKMLEEVGCRLHAVCRSNSFVARLGGDEFALIARIDAGTEGLRVLGEQIRCELRKPYDIVGTKLPVSASVGFAFEDDAVMTASDYLERADYALYRAKKTGSGIEVYSSEHDSERRQFAMIEHQLRNSDWREEMHVVFQPQVNIHTGETVGFEALARWHSPEFGEVRPDAFISVAERAGLIGDLTPLFLEKALDVARLWPAGIKLSFNLSVRDINSPVAMEKIAQIVRQSRFPAKNLEFEVTETMVMSDLDHAETALELLRGLGASVALDDFGTGYSNFQKIEQLSIRTVKIDRSFVRRLTNGDRAGVVIGAMIDLCTRLGIGTVIEGVETAAELDAVSAAGADIVQGYYFSRPMPAEDLAAYLIRTNGEAALRARPAKREIKLVV